MTPTLTAVESIQYALAGKILSLEEHNYREYLDLRRDGFYRLARHLGMDSRIEFGLWSIHDHHGVPMLERLDQDGRPHLQPIQIECTGNGLTALLDGVRFRLP